MKRKYFLKKAIRTARLTRLLAKVIDLFIVLILSVLFYPVGLILSIVYLSVCDSLQGGQSVGKKFLGFSVISLEDGTPCSVQQSFKRNLPFIIPLGIAIFPIWGVILGILTTLCLIPIEVYFIFKLDPGHRLGDVMADTSVMGHDGDKISTKAKKSTWFDGTETHIGH